jgi:hypothetical protein
MHGLLAGSGLVLAGATAAYALLAATAVVLAVRRGRRSAFCAGPVRPAVTVLKPLCGNELALYEQLCSVCAQDYPQFQLIFGLQNSRDSALPAVRRVQRQFGALDIDCVIDATRYGANAKVSNLINMLSKPGMRSRSPWRRSPGGNPGGNVRRNARRHRQRRHRRNQRTASSIACCAGRHR